MIARYLYIAALAFMFIVMACQENDNPVYGPDNPDPNPPGGAAVLTEVNPTTALPGKTVIITGTGFNTVPSENMVKFGTSIATVSAATATQLTVISPPASGDVMVSVAPRGAEVWSNGLPFSFQSYIPIITDPEVEIIADDILWPNGVDVDDAGNVYVGSHTDAVIYKIDPAGVKTVFAAVPVVGSIHFGPNNYLYVSEKDDDKVVRISPDGLTIEDVVTVNSVLDFDWDADGNMYLIGGGSMYKIPAGGSITEIASDIGSVRNCRIFGDYIYVNKVWDGELTRFDISGAELGGEEVYLEGDNPLALDFDAEGVLYWTTAWETSVYLFAPGGAEEAIIYEGELETPMRYLTYHGQDIYIVYPGWADVGVVLRIHVGVDQAPRYGQQ